MTSVSIVGREFHLDGIPTYEGRMFEDKKIQGLLTNVRAVQAVFDDTNPDTCKYWEYPDTGKWDPDRNVDEFCDALAVWKDHGVLAFTLNFQGGGPLYVPEIYKNYDNNGFTSDGKLKPAYAARIKRVLDRADELGMVALCGLFYWVYLAKMDNEKAIWRAAEEGLSFLRESGNKNVLVEIANEIEVVTKYTDIDLFTAKRQAEMIKSLKTNFPEALISTSSMAVNHVNPNAESLTVELMEQEDYILLHGNQTQPAQLGAALRDVQNMPEFKDNPKPILINEDSPAVPNFDACWENYVSWGYYDQGFNGQEADDPYMWYEDKPRYNNCPYEELNGFQTPPVNWSINTKFKKDFFSRVAEVTGYPGATK